MSYNPKDFYFKKAKKEDFAARSVFKLEEIDKKFKLIREGQLILDLGAAPGSWSQYCSKKVGANGKVIGVDLTAISLKMANAVFLQKDIREVNFADLIDRPADLVISDMAPKTTGIKSADQARSLELCELALDTADKHLKTGGHFICKLFHSDDFNALRDRIKKHYEKFEALRPDSTRKSSKEIFLIGIRRK